MGNDYTHKSRSNSKESLGWSWPFRKVDPMTMDRLCTPKKESCNLKYRWKEEEQLDDLAKETTNLKNEREKKERAKWQQAPNTQEPSGMISASKPVHRKSDELLGLTSRVTQPVKKMQSQKRLFFCQTQKRMIPTMISDLTNNPMWALHHHLTLTSIICQLVHPNHPP